MGNDGHKLWLQYDPLGDRGEIYHSRFQRVFVEGRSATADIIRNELLTALTSLIGLNILSGDNVSGSGIIVCSASNSDIVKRLGWADELRALGPEGFVFRFADVGGGRSLVIASVGEIGTLYGAFHVLRLIQTCQPIENFDGSSRPKLQLRLMNHWDNLDGDIERGYAGHTLWNWAELPNKLEDRYTDYARANASLGINGAVLNNVNANPKFITAEYLKKAAALADLWRPFGIRVYLSANFASPRQIGGMKTSDPMDKDVQTWWKKKADEIYSLIPDFGGFVVKANSEGQPGPQDYGRTHADGANLLADALAPHGGVVFWRAFVYNQDVDPDRIKRAYIEFKALDGQFRPNVAIQVKNGPLDFQPREPFHPLFGALDHTPIVAEIQAAQEYLGHSKHLVYLGTMWKEFLDSDTCARGAGSIVGKVLQGSVIPSRLTGMVNVSNTGSDRDWCGHIFSQSNWYAFGRLAWDPELPAEHIAEEWTRMTFGNDSATVNTVVSMMLSSRETFVSYSMPLGLHHLIGGDHYAPMPWNAKDRRDDWTAAYYHRAGLDGVGFDRTRRGDKAVEQYFPPVCEAFDDLAKCPDKLLLWFHRVAWNYKMRSGKTLWQELCDKYYSGHEQAKALQKTWDSLAGKIDPDRHKAVADKLKIQVTDSGIWRDKCLQYFQTFSKMPITPSSGA